MAKPFTSYEEAFEVLQGSSPLLSHGFYSVTLAGGEGLSWGLRVQGGASPAVHRLLVAWGLSKRAPEHWETDEETWRTFRGYVGRVEVRVSVSEHKVRRIGQV